MFLEKIKGPESVKELDAVERQTLIEEMRTALLLRASVHGGHVGPDLGFVEAAVALHTVFTSRGIRLSLMSRISRIRTRC